MVVVVVVVVVAVVVVEVIEVQDVPPAVEVLSLFDVRSRDRLRRAFLVLSRFSVLFLFTSPLLLYFATS